MTPQALITPARLAGIPLLRTQTDERLVDLVRSGNDAAFEAIVARYRRPLLRYCSKFLSHESADDAVQQVFVRAYDALRSSDGEMRLRPWLYRIAHNTALNSLRDRTLGHEQLSEEIDGVERPDQAYEKNQRLRDVVSAVGALPDRQRDALVLRELEGRSYDEIAASIGVSNGAVRQLLNRARMTLRAGATALTPYGLLTRIPLPAGTGSDSALRVAELCGGTAGGAVLAKVCATALVTGAVLGGVAAAPDGADESKARPEASAQGSTPAARVKPAADAAGGDRGALGDDRSQRVARRPSVGGGRGAGDDDVTESREAGSSGPGSGDDRSGPGGGGDDRSGSNSGPGSGSDSSGPGPADSGSGSGSSGSGSSGSGSSGSGSSGSGSDSTESSSGTSGSGSSGSGSGGSGSIETERSGSDLSASGQSGSDSGDPTAVR